MGAGRGEHAGFGGSIGLGPAANALEPVTQVQHLAVGLVVEILAAVTLANDALAGFDVAVPVFHRDQPLAFLLIGDLTRRSSA